MHAIQVFANEAAREMQQLRAPVATATRQLHNLTEMVSQSVDLAFREKARGEQMFALLQQIATSVAPPPAPVPVRRSASVRVPWQQVQAAPPCAVDSVTRNVAVRSSSSSSPSAATRTIVPFC